MAHFAQLDEDGVVLRVIVVANEDILDENGQESEAKGIAFCKRLLGQDTNWAQTSYNNNKRTRFAGPGYKLDRDLDAFIEPQPFDSWTLDAEKKSWKPPVALPDNIKDTDVVKWNERAQKWDVKDMLSEGEKNGK